MLLVNGSPVPDVNVWKQTVAVVPNTNYAFATWVQALYPPNPAQLSFSINGKDVGSQITASLPTCTWDRFFTTWNSGSNTTATISIVNKNTFVQGNDFALDDISFSAVIIKQDSVKISIDKPAVKAGNDTLVCEGSGAQLAASGALTYSWLPAAGLSNAAIANPIATVSGTTQFVVKGISAFGCSALDSVIINIKPNPVITTNPDTAFCKGASVQLTATGGTTYSWSPATGLNNTGIFNPVAAPAGTTKYIVTGTGINGCKKSDTVTVTVNPLPLVKTIADIAICLGNSLPVATSGAASYSWSPAAGVSNTTISNPVITPTDTAQYIVKGASLAGCIAFDTLNIFTRQLPVVKAGNDTIICASTTIQLLGSGGLTYSWSPSASLNNAAINNPIATPADTTEYIVKGTDAFGCSSNDSVTVFTRPLPIVTLTADTSICKSIPVQLTAGGGVKYQWLPATGLSNPAVQNPIAIILSTQIYKVIVTAANNCTAQDSVKITVKADPVFSVSPNDSTCFNSPVQLNASGGNSYSWSPSSLVSNAGISTPVTVGNSTTVYSVIIKENTCNFTDTLTTTITVFPLPPVKAAKANDVDCAVISTRLIATGATQYTWSPAASLSSSTDANPLASPENTILYKVTGTDVATACSAADTITVFVNKTGSANLFVPGAFSPNGDLLNECWKIKYQGRFTEFAMSVYNRYGELVFFTRNPDDCWDGTFKGKPQNPGNFVYMIKAKNFCREQFKKGNLLLLR